MPFRDNYTNFWFNDISSETMKVWVTNNKDLQFQLTPSFSDTFVAPAAAQTRYYTGTSFTSSDLSVKCIAIGVTMHDWRAIQSWLNPLARGRLHFDFNNKTYYEVKVKSQIKGNVFVAGDRGNVEGDVYNIEFTVEFTTVGDWAALGPTVSVPMATKFNEMELVSTKSYYSSTEKYSYKNIKLTISYNEFYSKSAMWDDATWWLSVLDSTEPDSATWSADLRQTVGNTAATVMNILLESIGAVVVSSLSSAINNKYWLPLAYNIGQSRNTKLPSYKIGSTTYAASESNTKRVYLTQPTVLHDKTIYIDTDYFDDIKNDSGVSRFQYFLLDSAIIWKNTFNGESIDYDKLKNNIIGNITVEETSPGTKTLVINTTEHSSDYGFTTSVPIDDKGIVLYGLTVMFCAASEAAYAACPLYYEEEGDAIALINAGSYESYPNLYLNFGDSTEAAILLNDEELYHYKAAVRNIALMFQGKTGFAIFNNMLAEAATLTSGDGNTKVITSSVNNGMMAIPSGNPELLKVRIFAVQPATVADSATSPELGLTNIFFQPVGEFKYSRNNPFAALLFKNVLPEQPYNTGFYPLIDRSFLESSTYGSRVTDYAFTTNGFVRREKMSHDVTMWVLTLPTSELTNLLRDINGVVDTPTYYYLSLCDYSKLNIASDGNGSTVRYLSMQTRDAC